MNETDLTSNLIPQQNNIVLNYNDPYFLTSGDNSNVPIVNHIFNGSNFVNWSRAIRMALIARNKLGFIDGTLKKPDATSPDYQNWIRNDYVVMNWLSNSIDKSISESLIFSNSSHQLWNEIVERYGRTNVPQLYDLHRQLMLIEQGDLSISGLVSLRGEKGTPL